jgi:hypothetical protein
VLQADRAIHAEDVVLMLASTVLTQKESRRQLYRRLKINGNRIPT